jgi:peptidoglycan/xylan/chitin deacetylase (PgdA/CDA1 family)
MDYVPDLSLIGRARRRCVFHRKVAPIAAPERSIITFGFDDFPKSAADTGADILDAIDAKAIFYACSGLAGRENLTGKLYVDTDMLALDRAGHEIGAHTHTHLDCAGTPTANAVRNITENLAQLKQMGLEKPVEHFAYPYGETTVALKKALTSTFITARGIRCGLNRRGADRMQLAAVELTPDTATTARAIHAIERATRTSCWLHIFTHDIRNNPSPYGTTPQELRKIAKSARDSGIQIETPSYALKHFGNRLDD